MKKKSHMNELGEMIDTIESEWPGPCDEGRAAVDQVKFVVAAARALLKSPTDAAAMASLEGAVNALCGPIGEAGPAAVADIIVGTPLTFPVGMMLVPIEPVIGKEYEAGAWSRRQWEAALRDQMAAATVGAQTIETLHSSALDTLAEGPCVADLVESGHLSSPRVRHSCELDMLSDCPGCKSEAAAAKAAESPGNACPTVCDGKEQEAFESWAKSQKYNMEVHPMHWLFLNERTWCARQGWAAAIKYASKQMGAENSR